jgi:4-hydroxy-tetrahydrodipicolinate synthase
MSIEGILPVIPTPFLDGRFDRPSFERLLEHMDAGVDGFVLLGSTGEAPSLTVAEREEIAAVVLGLTDPAKTVVVGVTDTCLEDSLRLARHAQEHGARGVLCASPFYFPNSDDGLRRWLAALDAALDIELVFYDNPVSTKTRVTAHAVAGWASELEHLNSVKLTDSDLSKIDVWHTAGLTVLAGDDPIAFQYLAAGVDGAMMIVPAVFPEAFRATFDLVRAGALEEAFTIFGREIAPFSHAFGIGEEIATTKALLADIGVFSSPEVRPPLSGVRDDRLPVLRAAFELGSERTAARTGG